MADGKIDLGGLPVSAPGERDYLVGTQLGSSKRFALDNLPLSTAAKARLDTLEAAQSAGMLGYATKALMDADLAHADGALALVTNDPSESPTNKVNGVYRKTGASGAGSWVQSADRVTGLEGKIGDVVSTLSADAVSIGYAGVIPDGASAAGASTFTLAVPITKANRFVRFAYFGRASGTAHVQVVSRAGTINTVVREVAVSIAPGYNEVKVELEHDPGQYFGFRAGSGLLPVSSGNPGFGYWSIAGQVAQGASYDDATASTSIFHVRIVSYGQVATGEAVQKLESDRNYIEEVVGIDPGALTWLGGVGATAPVDGSGTGSRTYAIATPASRDFRVKRVRAFSRVPGTVTLRRFSRFGDEFSAVGDDLVIAFDATGVVEVAPNSTWTLRRGEYYAIVNAANIISVTASTPADGGYYDGPSNSFLFTDSAATTAYTLQIGIEFEPATLDGRVAHLESESGAPDIAPPDGYIIVWGLGESHMAGRGERHSAIELPPGAAYKFVRSTASLAHLADPTGNDTTAIAGGGKGSLGPALANTIWRMTDGSTGVIFVNSGLGSSTIGNQWAAAGSGWASALADWTAAVSAISALKLPVAGVALHLAIGSNDAAAGTTKAAFKAAVLDLFARCRAATGADMRLPLVLAQVGDFTDGSTAAGVASIREAQTELVTENANVFMGWSGAKTFVDRSLMIDNVHYRQAGNDIAGRGAAAAVGQLGLGLYVPGVG